MKFLSISEILQKWPCFVLCLRKLSTDHSSLQEQQSMVRRTSTCWKSGYWITWVRKSLTTSFSNRMGRRHRTGASGLDSFWTLPDRWIGRSGRDDHVLMPCPPRSSDLTPCDFFLWGFVKGLMYVPLLPKDVDELTARMTEAVATIDNAMLERVWQELDYRLDVCRVTNGAHIEHLWTFHKKIEITSFQNTSDAFLYP